jgi:hypothetical protein
MQFAENFQANWQEEYCFITRLPEPIQPELQWELLEYPPHSPDLSTCDFHLFGPLKHHLGGKCFADDEDIETEV